RARARPATTSYLRSLPMDTALDPDTILAHEMNGERLPEDHGHPIRLVVPRWFGMASAKWLRRITVLDRPFEGYFQTEKYVLKSDGLPPMPLTACSSSP
ncbi:MAG: molybdopterin-dependent oxidoreductase, partial [Candidatus Brocadiia bacterium]|nr:molybdopterin-dependent oxidoreductase [Candidatus Brocadiia bacterium]